MTFDVYTKFPNLLSKRLDDDNLKSSSFPLPRLQGSREILLLAWANVLSSYSGQYETVSFLSDEGRVEIDVCQQTSKREERGDEEGIPRDATGVFFAPTAKPFNLAIELHVDVDERVGRLCSNGLIPSKQLPQIGILLKEALDKRSSGPSYSRTSPGEVVSLSVLNETPCPVPGPELLHELVNFDGGNHEIAIDYFDHDFTKSSNSYEEINIESARLAATIRTLARHSNLKMGDAIPVLIPQSPILYISLLAVLRAGFAFCPLQLDAPPDRLRFIIQDVGASIVVTVSSQASKLSAVPDITILEADDSKAVRQDLVDHDPSDALRQNSTSTAYIMYTSGSTGQPKGVPVSHRSVTQSLLAHDRYIPKFSRFLQFAAPTFDVSVFEIFFTLFRKVTLVVCERSRLLIDLPAVMRSMQVDAAELTPTVAGGLLQNRGNVPSLKLLLTIGEMLTPQVIKEFGGNDTQNSILWGMYGPTEAAIHCTLQPAFSANHRTSNIGFPLGTVSAFIVSMNGEKIEENPIHSILPIGFVGELAIGGLQLADGYLSREEQTAKAFIKTEEYGILYRTGDKARMLLDGTIECLGRISSGQVKLRGQRIEIGEVQYAVSRADGCRDTIVSIINGIIVAFCLTARGATVDSILAECRKWLPSFMVPGDIVVLQEFPRLVSGKIDLQGLESLYESHKSLTLSTNEKNLSEKARIAQGVLEEVLGQKLGSKERLSASGLDSLVAIRAASLLRKAGFISILPVDLLSDDTIEEIFDTQELVTNDKEERNHDSSAASNSTFEEIKLLAAENEFISGLDSSIESIIPCTPLQRGMLAETAKDATAYCNWVELEINAPHSYRQVVQWIQNLAQSHAMLRSGFCQLNSRSHPYACITWSNLQDSQFKEVASFSRSFSLDEKGLLRPSQFQVCCKNISTRILMQLHHSLFDGWSIDLLLRDLHKLSHGVILNKGQDFAQVSRYYCDVDTSSALEYWQNQLLGFLPSSLPNFNGYMIEKSEILTETFQLSTALAQVQQTADEIGCSKHTIFEAAVAYLLSGYLGTPDIVMGMVTSGRSIPVPVIEDVVGPCLATCPLRINVSHSKSVEDLLRNIQELNTQMVRNADLSIDAIKRACDMDTSLSLWDVLFVWQESLESRLAEGRNVKLVASADRLECALTLEFEPREGTVISRATFHTRHFPKSQIALLLRQVDSLVAKFVHSIYATLKGTEQGLPVDALSILNRKPQSFTSEHSLEHHVEEHALKAGDEFAVIFATEIEEENARFDTLTYKQLNDQANQLARFVQNQDPEPTELVCICMEKSLDLYVAILAVLKLGRGYLPIAPATPLERAKVILSEAGVTFCLSQSSIPPELCLDDTCTVINVDDINTSNFSTSNLETKFDGSKAAYAVFTSGSTGVPKGVVVTQQNLLSNLASLTQIYPISPGNRLLQACSQAFDVSVFEIFFSWQVGMCLCSATNDVLFKDIEASIRALEITHLSLTPTVTALIDPSNVPNVEFLVTAGEGVTEKVMKAWAGRGLYQGYGPSETTNICSVKPNVQVGDLIENIGPPLKNTSAFVLDLESDTILPMGAVGELCFGGDQVFRGYMNQPELTASKIIQHAEYGRLYRSGDLGRILPDGSILFAGRLDDQVKVRGQRVELNEINHRILEVDGIRDCATVVVKTSGKQTGLVTFWVPAATDPQTVGFQLISAIPDGIRNLLQETFQHLFNTLPSYMIPVMLVPITKIPMTAQGKIDRHRLSLEYERLPAELVEVLATNDVDSRNNFTDWTPEENIIAEALARTLDRPLDNLRRRTSFLNLGLDSITSIAFARYLKKALSQDVSVSQILRNPSIAQLSRTLKTTQNLIAKDLPEMASLLPAKTLAYAQEVATKANVGIIDVLPCTPLQEAMLSSSSQDANLYCNTMVFKIHGDTDRLKECWNKMCSRHAMLSTVFIDTPDPASPFLQLVLAKFEPEWEQLQISSPSLLQVASDTVPVTLNSFKPPYALRVIRCGSQHYFQFTCHHALQDGAATAILLEEIEQVFKGQKLPPPISARPFLGEMLSHRTTEHERFWVHELKDFQPTLLAVEGHTQKSTSLSLASSLSSLEKISHELSLSLLSLSQIAWAKTLSSLLGTSDICFGNVVSGRTVPVDGMEKLVAPTFNTIPFRVSLDRHRNNLDLLKTAQGTNTASLSHQLFPLRAIQSKVGHSGSGLFSTLLLLQYSNLLLDPAIWALEHEHGVMDFPLILELIPNRCDDTLQSILYYNTSILGPDESMEVLHLFHEALITCIRYPSSSGQECPHISEHTLQSVQKKIVRPKSTNIDTANGSTDDPTPTQSKLCRLLADFTGADLSMLSTSTTIHQIGIDSISAIQLAAKLRTDESINITAAELIERPSIKEMAKLVDQKRSIEDQRPEFDFTSFHDTHLRSICNQTIVSDNDIECVLPCTPTQNGLVSQFLRTGTLYVNYVTYALKGDYEATRIIEAWRKTMEDYTMLRTGFVPLEDNVVFPFAMVTYRNGCYPLPVQSVSPKEKLNVESWREECTRKFHEDLSTPPWAAMLQETQSGLVMHLTLFHGLYDAISLELVLLHLIKVSESRPVSQSAPIKPVLSDILSIAVAASKDDRKDSHAAYWKRTLIDATFNPFPDLTPLHVSTKQIQAVSRVLNRKIDDLEITCRQGGYTLQAAGQTAWARLLATYLGEESVAFGVVLSGRDVTPGAEHVVFPCLATVPFAVTLSGKRNDEVMNAAMAFNSSVRKHQFCRMGDIQKWAGREPLFDTIFAFQKTSNSFQSLPWEILEEISSAEYAVSLELEPTNDGNLLARVTFKENLIPESQAAIMLDQFNLLLANVIESPESLALDSPLGDELLLSITPAKHSVLPSPVDLLHKFVEIQAKAIPNKTAFEFFTRSEKGNLCAQKWTYEETNQEGNRIANFLQSRGVKPGSAVGICFDKCPEASFGILGILKGGCAYVAIDPSAPPARKSFIVQDSKVEMILTTERKAGRFDGATISVPVVYLDEMSDKEFSTDPPQLSKSLRADSVCYCLYTSGTTGTPKGCEITHENAVQAMRAFSRLFSGRWNKNSRWLQFASFHFDVSVLEQYWSWSEGICVVSAPRDLIFENIEDTIRDLGITHIDLTPSLASLVRPENVPSLCKGVFITGGEQLKQEILDVWGPEEVIHNGYGPTEATIGVTMFTRVPKNGKPSNIGPQFDNVSTYVLRPDSDIPVLRGGVGELCIGGKLVGKGYLNRPDLTAEKFPYMTAFQERIYRTGDLVRILQDGSFLFLGRADDQVKLRGQRLEIGEINTTIRKGVPNISDVSTYVLRRPNQQRDQLVTFFVSRNSPNTNRTIEITNSKRNIADLELARETCGKGLPAYMVPTYFIPVNRMPLSTNNKTDAKALKSLFCEMSMHDLQELSSSKSTNSVISDTEKIIAKLLAGFTNVEIASVGLSSNIFELGLDSISVISFSSKLKKAGLQTARPALVMANPTVKSLANELSMQKDGPRDEKSVAAARQTIFAFARRYRAQAMRVLQLAAEDELEALAPCTPLQEGMILKALQMTQQQLYFSSFSFTLAREVDAEKLQRAWQQACNQLQILRTRFIQTDDGMAQAVLRRCTLPFDIIKGHASDFDDTLVKRRVAWIGENQSNFFRPLELILWDHSESKILTINIFHALYDGNSLPRVFALVRDLYDGTATFDTGPQFHDSLPHGPLRVVKGTDHFWARNLKRTMPMRLDVEAGPLTLSRRIDNMRSPLDNCRKRLNVTHQALIQAAWMATLSRFAQGVISTGIVCSGRAIDFEGAEQVIGPLFNTIPFHLNIRSHDTWRYLVETCHNFNVQALLYLHTPLRQIQKACHLRRDDKLFETLFVFQMETESSSTGLDNELWSSWSDQSTTEYPLSCEAELKLDNSLFITLVSQGRMVNGNPVDDILKRFESCLATLVESAEDLVLKTLEVPSAQIQAASQDIQNRVSAENTNSVHESGFEWTKEALVLRAEIARLAGVDVGEVAETASIFELGLDSIDAIKLSSRLSAPGLRVPVSAIMQNPTISSMLQWLGQETQTSRPSSNILHGLEAQLTRHLKIEGLYSSTIERVLPATPLQEVMVSEMMISGYSRYFNHDILKINLNVDLSKLKTAWQKVFELSPTLRTSFCPINDPELNSLYAQVVSRKTALPWKEIEVPDSQKLENLLGDIQQETSSHKEPGTTNFKLTLARSSSNAFLIISLPHCLYDGWSIQLIHRDVSQAYFHGFVEERPDVDSILEDMVGAVTPSAEEFWSDFLSEARPCLLSHKYTESPKQEENIIHRKERLTEINAKDLRLFCKRQGVTLQTFGQTCFSLVLASFARRLDLVFGMVLSGRDTEEAQSVMFPTMNTIAFHTILHGTKSELLKQTQDMMSSIRTYQHFPLRKAQGFAKTEGQKLFDSLFIYQSRLAEEHNRDENLYESVGGSSDVELPVCVEMEVVDEQVIWRVACHEQILNSHSTETLLDRIELAVQHMVVEVDDETVILDGGKARIGKLPEFEIIHLATNDHDLDRDIQGGQGGLPPIGATIRSVLSKVSHVLEDEIREHSTLYHLGLDSISAIKVASLLKRQGVSISVSNLLRSSTLLGIAKYVNDSTSAGSGVTEKTDDAFASNDPISQAEDAFQILNSHNTALSRSRFEAVLAATAGQIYMLNAWQNSRGRLFFDEFTFSIVGQISSDDIQSALEQMISRHPILRTVFTNSPTPEMPILQLVLAPDQVEVEKGKLSDRTNRITHERERFHIQPKYRIAKNSEQPFVRVFYEQQAEKKLEIGLKIHHSMYDGLSLPNLLSELRDLIQDPKLSIPRTPSPDNSFFDFVQLSFTAKSKTSVREFWRTYLAPVSKSSPMPSGHEKDFQRERFSKYRPGFIPDANGLIKVARLHGLTLPSIFLAIYARLCIAFKIGCKKGDELTDKVVIGIYIANRSQDLPGLGTFPTVNLLPVCVDTSLGVLASAARIQEDIQKISELGNVSVGLWEIYHWTGVQVDTFVNWVRMPEGEDGVTRDPFLNVTSKQEMDEIIENPGTEFEVPEELRNDEIAKAYPVVIDVEVALRDEALDVGIFGPTALLEPDLAEVLLRKLKDELLTLEVT